MKFMKLFVAVTALVFASSQLYAGDKNHGHHGKLSEKRIEKMQQQLDLTDAQVTQLQAIADKYKQQKKDRQSHKKAMKALHKLDPSSADYEQKLQQAANKAAENTKARVLHMGHRRADIQQVLTPVQQNKMKGLMKQKRQQKKDKKQKRADKTQ